MKPDHTDSKSFNRFIAWCVHALTASGVIFGMLALYEIHETRYISAFWFLAISTAIDGVDGFFARKYKVREVVPRIDGALLDNITDYVTFVIAPSFMLMVSDILPEPVRIICGLLVPFASTYQFSQKDAKTEDHFFKGFPSYWNIVVFYLFICAMNPWLNFAILLFLALTVFIPVKYVYPSRLEYLSSSATFKLGFLLATILWAVCSILLLVLYPQLNAILLGYTVIYILFYIGLSLYRTFVPMQKESQDELLS